MRFANDGETGFGDGGVEPPINSHEEAFISRVIDANRCQATGGIVIQEACKPEEADVPTAKAINLDYLAATGISKYV